MHAEHCNNDVDTIRQKRLQFYSIVVGSSARKVAAPSLPFVME